jgi:hypothetical protein
MNRATALYLERFDALFQQHMDVALLPALGVGLLHPADVPVPRVQGVRPCQQQKQCLHDYFKKISQPGVINCVSLSSVVDPGCLSRIPDPNFFHPGSRIRIKELKNFNPKNCFQALGI